MASQRLGQDLKTLTEGLQSMGVHMGRVNIMGQLRVPIPLEEALICLQQQVHILLGLGRMDPMLEVTTHQLGPFQRNMMTLVEKCSQHTGIPRLPAVHISLGTRLKRLVHSQ